MARHSNFQISVGRTLLSALLTEHEISPSHKYLSHSREYSPNSRVFLLPRYGFDIWVLIREQEQDK